MEASSDVIPRYISGGSESSLNASCNLFFLGVTRRTNERQWKTNIAYESVSEREHGTTCRSRSWGWVEMRWKGETVSGTDGVGFSASDGSASTRLEVYELDVCPLLGCGRMSRCFSWLVCFFTVYDIVVGLKYARGCFRVLLKIRRHGRVLKDGSG